MHRNSPFDPYLTRMRNEIEMQSLRAQIHAHMTKDSPQFRRTRRFAQLIQYLLADFLPHDRDCRRRIEEHLLEAAFAGNCEIINVPPECDELDKLQLERRMLETKMSPLIIPLSEPQQSQVSDGLIERLRNPMWAHSNAPFESPQLEQEENLAAMSEAAAEIGRLRAPAQTFPMSREQLAKVFAYIWDGDANEWRAFTDKADAFLTCPLTQPESRS